MWDPPKNEDDTPWADERTERVDSGAGSPTRPTFPAPAVGSESPAGTPPPPPTTPKPTPPADVQPAGVQPVRVSAPTTPPPSAPTTPAPIVRAPAAPKPPGVGSALPDSATKTGPIAPPVVTNGSTTATQTPPSAFSAIGSPRPEPQPPLLSTAPSVTPRPASAPMPQAAAVQPTATLTEAPKTRRWPWFLLALGTIAASGLVAWLVASSVQPEPTTVAIPSAAEVTTTTPRPAASEVVDVDILANEPFAAAAEIIRPSVVRLELVNGLGTGVIINSNGTILTAAHVVGTSDTLTVVFADGSRVEGEVVGTHEPTDVAVVRVDPEGRDLVPAALADGEDVRVGQLAVAVGSPFGFDQTVTAGIISAVDRLVPGSDASFVQTDAPINPANSGGPLINLDGEVVGINDLIFTESGDSAGVGFAISIDIAIIIADQIVAGIEPQVALLGVSTGAPADGSAGALVNDVGPGTAADNAGIEVGDIVVGVNGTNTRTSGDLRAQIIDIVPGSDVSLLVIRDGEEVELLATLGQTGQ